MAQRLKSTLRTLLVKATRHGSPEDDAKRAVYLESLMLSYGAGCSIVGQKPVSSDLGRQRQSLGFSRIEKSCLDPTTSILQTVLIQGEGLNPVRSICCPGWIQAFHLGIDRRRDQDGADGLEERKAVSFAEVKNRAGVADNDPYRLTPLRLRAQRMSSS